MIELNKIHNIDCLEGMQDIPDKSIDLILCDLPYGTTQNPKDIVIPFEPLWRQYNRIIKDRAAIVLFAQGLFYVDLVNSNRSMFRYDMVWDKVLPSGFLNANRMPLRGHEQIVVFYKQPPRYYPQKVKGEPNHSKGKPKTNDNHNYGGYDFVDNGDALGDMKHPTSILRFSKPHPSIAKHPTEKSVELCEWIIKSYTEPNAIVLDNCMGSGTTAEAAIRTGRRFYGFEIDTAYCDIANERIQDIEQRCS